jgi:hypothetical protein
MQRSIPFLFVLSAMALAASSAFAQVRVEVIPGRPFGVGHITVPLSAADANDAQLMPRLWLTEAKDRILYPAIARGRFREIVGNLLGGGNENALPGQVSAYFLFTGDEPLHLTFYTPVANTVVVTPRPQRPRAEERLMTAWWREYQEAASTREAAGEVPPIFDAYLTTMLSQRLALPPSRREARELRNGPPELTLPQKTMDLLLGVEKLRAETLRDKLLRADAPMEAADVPLPPDVDWSKEAASKPPEGVEVEPIAMHVPMECFYIRFGKFSNYLWLDNLTEEYGGDLANMLSMRGQNLRLGERSQKQLCLRKNELAQYVGDQVIADVAMIGRDIYTHEGAAVGMLFQARNSRLLGNDLTKTRATILKEETERGAKTETIKIAGHDVSFISTPDNRLRSFYAVDGDFHLVTTSRNIVERFYEAGEGHGALGSAGEFHNARQLLPTSRNDTIFVYFSSALFQSLVGPQYQVELARRLQSVTDIELLYLARLAAKAEGQPSGSIADLIEGHFLPTNFGRRPDGSRLAIADGRIVDSIRGARGSYAPICDMELGKITEREASRLAQLSQYLQTQWPDMDPVMVGIHRSKLNDKGLERINVEANTAPVDEKKYGWLTSMIGPPATKRILPVQGDVIHVQAFVQGTPLDPQAGPHHMFLGVQDHVPLEQLKTDSLISVLRFLRTTPGYLGAWPRPGTLDRLPLGLGGRPDEFGFARMPLGLWRRTVGPWSALSFDPGLLAQATEQFQAEDTDNPAQVRVHVGNIVQTKLAAWVDALYYDRARQTSIANAALLQHVVQQFHVSPPKARALVEEIIDGELVCALGGEYEAVSYRDGATFWQSDAWPVEVGRAPKGYDARLLEWFRGLDADLTKQEGRIMLRAQLDMQRQKPEQEQLQLPLFNLPNVFKDFGKTATPKADKPKVRVPKPEDLPPPQEETPRRDF